MVGRGWVETLTGPRPKAIHARVPSQAHLGLPTLGVLAEGAVLLRGFALAEAEELLLGIAAVCEYAPFRHLVTPGGLRMSVAMTNCGAVGWVSDRGGYRYVALDPDSGLPWSAMPPAFTALATRAAARAGFPEFVPDCCLVNRYEPGARLTLHQDRNERGYTAPVVSVSLGVPAVFQFGGLRRADPTTRVDLEHGDVVAWGGPARMNFHGVLPLREAEHPATGNLRYNLTFRLAR